LLAVVWTDTSTLVLPDVASSRRRRKPRCLATEAPPIADPCADQVAWPLVLQHKQPVPIHSKRRRVWSSQQEHSCSDGSSSSGPHSREGIVTLSQIGPSQTPFSPHRPPAWNALRVNKKPHSHTHTLTSTNFPLLKGNQLILPSFWFVSAQLSSLPKLQAPLRLQTDTLRMILPSFSAA
jgi:hypothetical protein